MPHSSRALVESLVLFLPVGLGIAGLCSFVLLIGGVSTQHVYALRHSIAMGLAPQASISVRALSAERVGLLMRPRLRGGCFQRHAAKLRYGNGPAVGTGSVAFATTETVEPEGETTQVEPVRLPERITTRLHDVGIVSLRKIQEVAIEAVQRGLDVIVHAETGSGKTLCFALPLLSALEPSDTQLQGLVLVPTVPLAVQHGRVFNSLHPGSAAVLDGAVDTLPDAPIVLGTPEIVLQVLSGVDPQAVLKALRFVVLDEADAMFKPLPKKATWEQRQERAKDPPVVVTLCGLLCQASGSKLQVIAASATVGRPLKREIEAGCKREFEIARASPYVLKREKGTAPRLVGLPSGMSVELVTYEAGNWVGAVQDVLLKTKASLPLLFTKEPRDLKEDIRLLRKYDLDAKPLESAILEQEEITSRGVAPTMTKSKTHQPQLFVGIPSDARGLDLHGVDLVIIFGVPGTLNEFLHLAGRTARMGACGHVVMVARLKEADEHIDNLSRLLGLNLASTWRHFTKEKEKPKGGSKFYWAK